MKLKIFSSREIDQLCETAVPQYGGPDGTLRVLCWPDTHIGGDLRTQRSWFDAPEGPEETITTYRISFPYPTRGFEMSQSRRDRLFAKDSRLPREVFEKVWERATARRNDGSVG